MFTKSTFIYTLIKMCILFAILSTQACSLVQWLPSSNCDYVEYIRFKNHVDIKAECEI